MTSAREFGLAFAESFPLDLGRAPKKVRKAYGTVVLTTLRERPDEADPPHVKKLIGYKSLWRLRVSNDYRLVYSVDEQDHTVVLLMLGHRNTIYDRLGASSEGEPGSRIVSGAAELLEKEPSDEEVGRATIEQAEKQTEPASTPDCPLPMAMDSETLTSWGIPSEYHESLMAVRTEGELTALISVVPDWIITRVEHGLWPPPIEDVAQQSVMVVENPADLDAVADGRRSLESFLLKLDEAQKSFVSRFEVRNPRGPWLLKGGPGSGKSTVALYCVKALVASAAMQPTLDGKPLRVLFTTFTKSLVKASEHLLEALAPHKGSHRIDVKNVDRLVSAHLPDEWKEYKPIGSGREFMLAALTECRKADSKLGFTAEDAKFLEDEVDWVLVGQSLDSIDDYLKASRAGRGRRLGQQQRRQVWRLFEAFKRNMRSEGVCLFSERIQQAARHAKPMYDYVFIDEAQDLMPVAIRFCIRLCRAPGHVFLTADKNQSIYGNALSWSSVADDLSFQVQARILRKNYRTTAELWQGICQLAPESEDKDIETLDLESVSHGPHPVLVRYSSEVSLRDRLNAFLHESLRGERVTAACAAVLCPNRWEKERVGSLLDAQFNAKVMGSGDLDLGHPGVKVLTMHAAKGLQFPVVALVGVDEGKLPFNLARGMDAKEHESQQHRLFFVACSRAMRRLAVFASANRPSPFVAGLTDDHWEIEELD